MAISDYDPDPSNNGSISGIDTSEGCASSGINNAIRQLMADISALPLDEQTVITTFSKTLLDNADLATWKVDLQINNVDNTSDANKPISTATQAALDGKQPLAAVLTNTTASFTTAWEAAINANTSKVSNATHTGDVTGDVALTIASSAVTTAKINNLAVTTAKLAADAVDGTKLADNAVDTEHIAADAVGASEIASGAVGNSELATGAVTAVKIASNTITATQLAANSVGASEIQANAVGSSEIADNAVGLTQMAHGTDGNLITYSSSGAPAYVTTGTANQVLTSNGAGAAPTFQTPASGFTMPAGAVQMYAGTGAMPSGWLLCDGTAVSRTTYADLFTAISTTYGVGDGSTTFNLPDMRGEFVRGADESRGIDSGRAIGSWQDEDVGPHDHSIVDPGHAHSHSKDNDGGSATIHSGGAGIPSGTLTTGSSTTGITVQDSTGTETRPRNVALRFIIKT